MATETTVLWNIKVSKETDLSVRSLLRSEGIPEQDLSNFVERAMLRQVFNRSVQEIKARNKDIDPDVLQAEIDQAVAEVRAEKKSKTGSRVTKG